MRNIIVTEFITLDGVIEAPHEWSFPYWDDGIAKFKLDEVMDADALLLGRITYKGFADAWPEREDETGFADKMNSMKKYVVSTTLKPEWNNSVLFKEHAMEEIKKIKAEEGGNILVAGSGELISSLIENDLIDEYRLLVYPLVLGTGKKLFTGKHHIKLTLTEEKKFEKGVTLLRYEPMGKPTEVPM